MKYAVISVGNEMEQFFLLEGSDKCCQMEYTHPVWFVEKVELFHLVENSPRFSHANVKRCKFQTSRTG